MKSTAIVFTEPEKVELRQEDVLEPGADEVTIQTLVSLISTGTESFCYRGEFDAGTGWANWVKYPFYPGYSNVAKVIKVGREVTGLKEGDRIFSGLQHQQFATISSTRPDIVKLPDYADDENASWSTLSYITQTAVRRGEHVMGDTACVIGLGPLGQLVVQYLRILGLQEILVIDTAQKRLDMAIAHGATKAFCGSAGNAREFVEEHTGGRLVDVVYDVTGHYAVFPLALKLVRTLGTLVLLGDSPHPSRQHLIQDVITRQIKIIGTQNACLPPAYSYWTSSRQILLFLKYVLRRQIQVENLITHRFQPTDAVEVYEMLQEDRALTMGVVFNWE
jgi:2-desacetyl-2-hydroxyethyl bacteriochlorophyllide A dehydrogenase